MVDSRTLYVCTYDHVEDCFSLGRGWWPYSRRFVCPSCTEIRIFFTHPAGDWLCRDCPYEILFLQVWKEYFDSTKNTTIYDWTRIFSGPSKSKDSCRGKAVFQAFFDVLRLTKSLAPRINLKRDINTLRFKKAQSIFYKFEYNICTVGLLSVPFELRGFWASLSKSFADHENETVSRRKNPKLAINQDCWSGGPLRVRNHEFGSLGLFRTHGSGLSMARPTNSLD